MADKHTQSPGRRDTRQPLSLRERLQALRNLPKFFSLMWDTSRKLTTANLLLRLVRSAAPVAALTIGKLIIDEIVRLATGHAGIISKGLLELVLLEMAVLLVSDVLGRLIALSDSLLGDLFSNKTSIRLMSHAASLDLYYFEDSVFYDKLERARQQTVGRTALMGQALAQFQDAVTIGSLAIALIAFNPWLLILLFVALVPAFLGEAHFNAKTYSFMRKWTPERRELDMLRYTGASDETAKEVKIFSLSGFLIGRYEKLFAQFYQTNRSLAFRRAVWGSVLAVIGTLGYYSAYLVIILRTVGGEISIGQLTFLAGSFKTMQTLLQGILTRFSTLAEGALYMNDLFEFFALEPAIKPPAAPKRFPDPIRQGFVLENVGFRYPNSDHWALKGCSLTLPAGEKLALVGENGAGKTTLVKLCARLYDPTEGRILLDGVDLREYHPDDLRNGIGVIFQDFVRYHMTAAENIAVGRIDERANRQKIVDAAGRSMADRVIARFPAGYDQMLGRRFDGGIDLSYGEWQKVALARAYMRDAQVLILDEPTASLDARAEHEVFRRFAELTKGKTAILISHRFSTVRMADRIVVLEKGSVLESGAHDELLARGGRYAELFNLQAEGYR
ncbi:MAG TPA: ABC transporter ATP-binding protein [Bacteroidota bacterium]|nr:ABC transporter ATP-binding protein [Bacteroidota bacterium]